MEEVDLCFRLKKAGWKIYYVPDAKVMHHAGGSAAKDWERSQENFFGSLISYFKKQEYSSLRMLMLKCSLSVALLIRSAVLLFSGQQARSKFYGRMSGRVWSFHG
jgi:GT2 family glycosyltransferase